MVSESLGCWVVNIAVFFVLVLTRSMSSGAGVLMSVMKVSG